MLAYYYQQQITKSKNEAEFTDYYNNLLRNTSTAHQDLTSRCRVCLEAGNSYIYARENTGEIIEALETFGNIRVSQDDHTTRLCFVCHKFIRQAIAFRKIAMKSDEIFKNPVVRIKIEVEINGIVENEQCISKADSLENLANHSKNEEKSCKKETAHFLIGDVMVSEKVAKQTEKLNTEKEKAAKQTEKLVTEKGKAAKQTEKLVTDKEKAAKQTENQKKTLIGENKNPKVTCQSCGKVVCKSALKQHMTLHDPDDKCVCHICGKIFKSSLSYYQHSLRHRTGFPYKCKLCPYRAQYAELLRSHKLTHTREYKFMCNECPARFIFLTNLNRHMLKHKERQFQCDACNKAFHKKQMLEQHYQNMHLGIKNHVCDICDMAFGNRNALMHHQRNVHKREKMLWGRMPSYLKAEIQEKKDEGAD